MAEYRIAVLASGSGTNLQALIDDVHQRGASIVLVASDNPAAGALDRAKAAGIRAEAVLPRQGERRLAYHRRLGELLREVQPDLVVLAGYMRLLPGEFVQEFSPILNVHPSLLPAFPGLDAPKQALEYGVKLSGCTVHLVDEGMDTGPILYQEAVAVLPEDTPEALHNRIKLLEHKLLVKAVLAFAKGQVRIEGRNICLEADCDEKTSAPQRIR